MKRKFLTLIILCVTLLCCIVGLTACGESADNRDPQIVAVYEQYKAYAVEKGETPLTYEEWLKSIKGEKGDKGADGKSAYQIWLDNGNSGTQADFLNWLKGQKGDTGEQGIQGEKGEKGNQGEQGADGRGIAKAEINSDGDLIITYTNGDIENVGNIIDKTDENPQGLDFFLLPDGTYSVEAGKAKYFEEIVIPATYKGKAVTAIGTNAFNGCSSLTRVSIPDSVTSIGTYAFYECENLTKVNYTGTIDSWCEIDFGYWMNNSFSLYINDKLVTEANIATATKINNRAFQGCSSLTSVTIGSSVMSIGDYAFYGCSSLTSVTIGDSVTSIGDYAFSSCYKLVEVYNKSSLNIVAGSYDNGYVGYYALAVYTDEYESKVSTDENGYIIYTDGEDKILVGYTGNETELTLPDGITEINKYAFPGNEITKVTIPDSVTSIGSSAFNYCRSLTSVTIGDSVTSIGSEAFFYCWSLTSINLPESVTSIGEGAFENCPIENAKIPAIAASYIKNGNLKTVEITSGESIGSSAFSGCSSLTSVTIGDSVTSIGEYAFYNCRSLTSVTIGNRVTSIGEGAFENCPIENAKIPAIAASYIKNDNLKTVEITSGESIGSNAFCNCDSLTSVTIPDSVTSIGEGAFEDCDNLQYNEYDKGLYLGNEDNPYVVLLKAKSKDITSCTINENTKVIANFAFYNCSSLASITIPDSVTSIGDYAFSGCSKLTSITIGNSVTSIGSSAFSGCSSLTSVTIGNSVTSIGENAFYGCSSLTSVTIPDSVTSIGDFAFYNCSSLTSITIPDSVTSIGSQAFASCSSLTSVTIGNSVTSIGYHLFYNCDSLTSVTFENPNGWVVNGQAISSDDLENTSTAAGYLKSTYHWYTWTRS